MFIHGTVWDYREARPWQAGEMGWPSLLLSLLYSSRTLVVGGWGAFGELRSAAELSLDGQCGMRSREERAGGGRRG